MAGDLSAEPASLTRTQQVALVVLRTLIGWHFLYEGLFKLWSPAWSRQGAPLSAWTAAGYLKAATGPFAALFHSLAASSLLPWIDGLVAWGLVLVGLGLMLGVFGRLAAWAAVALLLIFYVAAIPTAGVPQPGTEGAYLVVNKNLIEAAALLVLLAMGAERVAGLDLLRPRKAAPALRENQA